MSNHYREIARDILVAALQSKAIETQTRDIKEQAKQVSEAYESIYKVVKATGGGINS